MDYTWGKCFLCNKKFKCQEWKKGIARKCCFSCFCKIKVIIYKLLNIREQKVLEMRFGLIDGMIHTLEEVGQEFGVTRERIRQTEAKALDKIQQYYKEFFNPLRQN